MVTNVTSFGKNGLYDWIVQRMTAVVLGIYALCVVSFLVSNPGMDYATWQGYMTSTPMVIFTTLTLFSLALHAWIGLWTVATDYLTLLRMGSKATHIRLVFQAVYMTVNVVYVVWGLRILWGA